jgi:hypothetical protein
VPMAVSLPIEVDVALESPLTLLVAALSIGPVPVPPVPGPQAAKQSKLQALIKAHASFLIS